MKKFLMLLGLLVFAGGVCNAQTTKGYTYASWFQFGSALSKDKPQFMAFEGAVAPGYAFNKSFFIRGQIEIGAGMWDNGGTGKTYRLIGTLGPTVGWNIVNRHNTGVVDVTATVGKSLIDLKDWNYLFYDLGASWSTGKGGKPMIGFGFRYYNSLNNHFDNHGNFYVKIGFRFN